MQRSRSRPRKTPRKIYDSVIEYFPKFIMFSRLESSPISGYGHLFCRTRLGQIVTIIYAIFGIPLTMTVLNNIGKLLYNCLRMLYKGGAKLFFKMWNACWKRAERFDHRLSGISTFVELDVDSSPNNLPFTVAVMIMVIYTLSSAGVFLYWEKDWDYFTAIYFMFVSLSTIGLGDVIPEHQMYMLSAFALILVGLALVSMCISVMQAKLERTYHEAFGSIEQSIQDLKVPQGLGPVEEKSEMEQVHHSHGKPHMPTHLGIFSSMDQDDGATSPDSPDDETHPGGDLGEKDQNKDGNETKDTGDQTDSKVPTGKPPKGKKTAKVKWRNKSDSG